MSSKEIIFDGGGGLKPGMKAEIIVAWPRLPDGHIRLQLVLEAIITGSQEGVAEARILAHQFRTRRTGGSGAENASAFVSRQWSRTKIIQLNSRVTAPARLLNPVNMCHQIPHAARPDQKSCGIQVPPDHQCRIKQMNTAPASGCHIVAPSRRQKFKMNDRVAAAAACQPGEATLRVKRSNLER
jgi:hypothetical protein